MIKILIIIAMLMPCAAHATDYMTWDAESATSSLGTMTGLYANTTIDCTIAHSGSCSQKFILIGNDGLNQPTGYSNSPRINYGWDVLGSRAIFYKWWMRIDTGFSWGDGVAKAKSSRAISSLDRKIYTGYIQKTGFIIGECDDSNGTDKCTTNTGVNNNDGNIGIGYDMTTMADSEWHEYIVKVKPNTDGACTAPANCDAMLAVWIDGVLIGEYNGWKLHTVAGDIMQETFGGSWMVKPYFQLGGTVSDGGTIYVDDFLTSDVLQSSFFPIDTSAPITTPSHTGKLSAKQAITLTANETATTQYCTGAAACTPATAYSGAVTVYPGNYLCFRSTDSASNVESTRCEYYGWSVRCQ